jgi:hypothetical protein
MTDADNFPPPSRKTTQTGPRATVIPATVVIAEFKINRGGDSVRVRLRPYETHTIIDIRTWTPDRNGCRLPGKGFACIVAKLPELARAINKALAIARELGLVDAEGE